MEGKITVRAHPCHGPRSIQMSDGGRAGIARAWRVYHDGAPTEVFVVDAERPLIGRTVVDYRGRMLTASHVGISAGDLARLVAPRLPDSLR